jgi:hypothetical protein
VTAQVVAKEAWPLAAIISQKELYGLVEDGKSLKRFEVGSSCVYMSVRDQYQGVSGAAAMQLFTLPRMYPTSELEHGFKFAPNFQRSCMPKSLMSPGST